MSTLTLREAHPIRNIATVLTEALRSIPARHLRIALLFGGVWALVMMLLEWQWKYRSSDWRRLAVDFVDLELGALWVLLIITIADAAIAHGARRRTAYVVAALAGCVVFDLVTTVIDGLGTAIFGLPPAALPNREWSTPTTARIYRFANWLLFVGAAVFLCAQWRAARRMQEHLRAAELDRVRKARLALESRLQALQARVEPGFLFRTLSQVRELYDRNAVLASADRASMMLDDLIAYLRAAMPHMRDTSSTVAQEVELARAYLDIARLRLDGKLGVKIAVAKRAADARMPPMMLLPLIDDALAPCDGEMDATPTIHVDVRAYGDRLQASVIGTPGDSAETDGAALASIRERLNELYGPSASVKVIEANARSVEARLDIPLEFPADVTGED